MNATFQGLKEVFQQTRYVCYAAGIAVVFFAFNVIITNYRAIEPFLNTGNLTGLGLFIFALIEGSYQSMAAMSFGFLILISLLVGVTFALILYRMKTMRAFSLAENKSGSIGAVMGLVVPGCASCGIGLLSAVGLSGALVKLPFKGVELSMVSAILLIYATSALAKKINEGITCRPPKKQK